MACLLGEMGIYYLLLTKILMFSKSPPPKTIFNLYGVSFICAKLAPLPSLAQLQQKVALIHWTSISVELYNVFSTSEVVQYIGGYH